MKGIQAFFQSLDSTERTEVSLSYLGVDKERFQAGVTRNNLEIICASPGFLQTAEFARRCRTAAVNTYIGASHFNFHHKFLELLAVDRPVLVCPRESEESRRLSLLVPGALIEAQNVQQVSDALVRVYNNWRTKTPEEDTAKALMTFSWRAQAQKLEQALTDAARAKYG